MLFKTVEAKAEAEAVFFFQTGQWEVEAEAVQESTASASPLPIQFPHMIDQICWSLEVPYSRVQLSLISRFDHCLCPPQRDQYNCVLAFRATLRPKCWKNRVNLGISL